eukprot:SAG11_NODE_30638_length_299_cov_0.720000_1_plen_30_part_01
MPPNNSHSVKLDLALMFLPAFKASGHDIYF